MCGCLKKEDKFPIDLLKELSDVADALDDAGLFSQANDIAKVMKRLSQQAPPAGTPPAGTSPNQNQGAQNVTGTSVDFGDGTFTTNDPDLIAMYTAYVTSGKNCPPGTPPNGLPPGFLQCLVNIPMSKPRGGGNYTLNDLSNLSMECLFQAIGGWVGRGTSISHPTGSVDRAKSIANCFKNLTGDLTSLKNAGIQAICKALAGAAANTIPGLNIIVIILKKAGVADLASMICAKA